VHDPTTVLHELRLLKDEEELGLLRKSCAIAAEAHRAAMELAAPGRFEHELEAAIDGRFRARGAAGPAYPTIVASGANATILHYVENRARLSDGDLVLVDAGCELDGYAADVTRTFPASGRLSSNMLVPQIKLEKTHVFVALSDGNFGGLPDADTLPLQGSRH